MHHSVTVLCSVCWLLSAVIGLRQNLPVVGMGLGWPGHDKQLSEWLEWAEACGCECGCSLLVQATD